eukprot:1214896-Pyramimonas_sp.AAC.1
MGSPALQASVCALGLLAGERRARQFHSPAAFAFAFGVAPSPKRLQLVSVHGSVQNPDSKEALT